MRTGICRDCEAPFEHTPNTGRVPFRCPEHRKRAHYGHCRPEIQLRAKLKRLYGMTPESWRAMFAAQGFACALCRRTELSPRDFWHTDHDHATGHVRGILCGVCNRGLGMFQDNPEVLRDAAAYLEGVVRDAC